LSLSTASVEYERGGFWRRIAALLVDALIVTFALQLAALVLFPLSHGRVQFLNGIVALHCDELDAVPEGIVAPPDFAGAKISDCRKTVFGLTTARVVNLHQALSEGAVTHFKEWSHTLDADGRAMNDPTLDELLLPVLLLLRFAFDRGGGTPGRRLLRIRLARRRDALRSPRAAAVNRRYGVLILPLLPSFAWSLLTVVLPDMEQASPTFVLLARIVVGVPVLLAALEALYTTARRRDAYYDRAAGTAVLRVDAHKAPIARAHQPLAPDAAVALAVPRRNYLVRHWRGELSLPVSYWLNGLLGGLAIGVMIGVLHYLVSHGHDDAQPVRWLDYLIAAWTFALLVTVWQSVGVWRAATRYRDGGKTFWGGAAKVMVVISLLQVGANALFVGVPQGLGIYEIVHGDTRVGPHAFHVLANGTTLEFSGGITFGVAKEMDEFLGAMSNVRWVQLNSIGGRILEAQKMSDIIKRRGLSTFVSQTCVSACTIVFLGGKDRLLLSSGRLGFHQPAFRGMTMADRTIAISTEEARLQRFGLSPQFAERANAAPPNDMWYPDKDELVREGVVTRLVPPPSGKPPPGDALAGLPVSGTLGDYASRTRTVHESAVPEGAAPAALPGPVAAPATTLSAPTVKIPADLMKQLRTSPPPKQANTLPATNAAPSVAKIPADLMQRLQTSPPPKKGSTFSATNAASSPSAPK